MMHRKSNRHHRLPTAKDLDHMSLEQFEECIREWLTESTRSFGGSYQSEGRSVSRSVWIDHQVENNVVQEKDRRETRHAQLREAARELAASDAEASAQHDDAAMRAARAALEIRNERQ